MGCSSSTSEQRPHLECATPDDNIRAPAVSDHYPELYPGYEGHEEEGDEEIVPRSHGKLKGVPTSSSALTRADEDEETVVTSIRATDVAVGLGRIPAGFYASVQHNGLEWQTMNKPISIDHDVVEWGGPIPIPSNLSATVRLAIYASFEFQPTLGHGELLRILTITVEQLLDRCLRELPFTFTPKDGDVVSPCSSVFVCVRRQKRGSGDSSESRVLGPPRSTLESVCRIDEATNLGHDSLLRYRKVGERRDLDRAIEQFEYALEICPLDHQCRVVAHSNLAIAKSIRCRVDSTDTSFEAPITLYYNALAGRPAGHPDRPSTLIHLAIVLLTRFERLHHGVDAVHAEAFLHEAMNFSSANSHEKHVATFVFWLYTRRNTGPYRELGRSSVEQSPTPGSVDEDPLALSSQLLWRFDWLGDLAALQLAISLLETSVQSTSVPDHRDAERLTGLGVALVRRFRHLGELGDLEQAISRHGGALEFTPDGHPDKPDRFNNLVHSFLMRFERLGESSDLEKAISSAKHAVELTYDGHPSKPGCLNNLALCFKTRFERFGELSDLEQAISRYRHAIELTVNGHPDKPDYLNNLANSFLIRFEHLGTLSDLEQAISMHQDAVELTPDGHLNKFGRLNNLANSFITRFENFGKFGDLEQAISRYRDAIKLTSGSHPNKHGCLNNLASTFLTRFKHLGELSDLEQAILMHGDAIELTPDDHPNKPTYLDNLACCFKTRFEHLGDLSDLDRAVSIHKHAIELTPNGHPDTPGYFNNLGLCLRSRFEFLGEVGDLEQAISQHKCAVELTPDGHPNKPACLSNLALSLIAHFKHVGELRDLEQAILVHMDAVELIPEGHPDKPDCLNNLALCFLTRFERLGTLNDLERTISTHRDAERLTPDGHPEKPACLSNLADSLLIYFKCHGDVNDLEEAISRYRDALQLVPDGHPNKPGCLNSLALCLKTRFEQFKEPGDLEQAILLYSRSSHASTGPTTTRFRASLEWISCARTLGHHSLLDAYSAAIDLLPQLAWIGLSFSHRYRKLVQGADMVREAAAAALDAGRPETAVEWLEQGRSIVWGELFQIRSSYEELSSAYPDHAHRLQQLSAALEHASSTRERFMSSAKDHSAESLEEETHRHRALAIARDKLLQEIRELPGFERFLRHKEFSQLCASAYCGPVVILNAAESRCDSLIVLADAEGVIHVPLPSFTLKRAVVLQNAMQCLLGDSRVIPSDDRVGYLASGRDSDASWESVLSSLWKGIVKPVLNSLNFSTPGDLQRIFWCPTGPFTFLPIHAAGLYGTKFSEPGHKVFDFVVSSYVPTLSILAAPRENNPGGDLRLLAVPQSPSDGQLPLPGVHVELEHIRAIIANSPAQTTLVEPSLGTVEEVLAQMKEAQWVHFACHGIQDNENPTDSGLCLADRRRLKLSDIISLSRRPRGGLAFLSACQTAMGDKKLTEEAVHIAAGMLFAGYGGVIGTMWSIADRVAPRVTKDIYERLLRNEGMPDHREAARALHDAVGRLRESNASFVEWLPFIHVGL